jgi:hypothetical protein
LLCHRLRFNGWQLISPTIGRSAAGRKVIAQVLDIFRVTEKQ